MSKEIEILKVNLKIVSEALRRATPKAEDVVKAMNRIFADEQSMRLK